MKIFSLAFCVISIAFSAVPAFAWNDVGHRITGYIAWDRMTPKARERVIEVLRQAPEDSSLGLYYQPYGIESEDTRRLEYFMLATTWSDIVRDYAASSKFRNEVRARKYARSNWHYDDTFWRQVNGRAEELSGFPEGGVAVAKLTEFNTMIRDEKVADRDKAIAIAWIMHLIGDLHQPLHTSARVTDDEPKGDQGGNLFLLTPKGTPRESQENLHWFWDSIVTQSVPYKNECEREYIARVARQLTKRHSFASVQSRLNVTDFAGLQRESFALAPTGVFSPDLVRFAKPSEKYKKRAFLVAEKQLAMAGYRMGELFNQVFGGQ